MSNENLYLEEDIDLGFDSVEDAEPEAEEEQIDLGFSEDDGDLRTNYFESIEPILEIDMGLDDKIADISDLETIPDGVNADNGQQLIEAIETNLKYKEAEYSYESGKVMTASDKVKNVYSSLQSGRSNLDKSIITTLLRSVINIDNSSIFSGYDEDDYDAVIYKIMSGVLEKLQKAGEISVDTQIAYADAYDDYEKCRENYKGSKHPQAYSAVKAKQVVVNKIINSEPKIKSAFLGIKSAIPAIQNLKQVIVSENRNYSKEEREAMQKLKQLQGEVMLYDMLLDPNETDVFAAIFASVQSPVKNQFGEVGMNFVCGHCGEKSFTINKPMQINHITSQQMEAHQITPQDKISYAKAMILVFNPIRCPNCGAINLFSRKFIEASKLAMLSVAPTSFISEDGTGNSDVNLMYLAEVLKDVMDERETKIIPPVEESKKFNVKNPLEDKSDREKSIEDFKSWIQGRKMFKVIGSDIETRNIQYLKYMFNIHPVVRYSMDKYSMLYTILKSNRDKFKEISEKASELYDVENLLYRHGMANSFLLRMEQPTFTESRISKDQVLGVLHQIADMAGINLEFDSATPDFTSQAEAFLSTVKEIGDARKDQLESELKEIIESYKDTPVTMILRENTGDKMIEKSGTLALADKILGERYFEFLKYSALEMIRANPSTRFFLSGLLKDSGRGYKSSASKAKAFLSRSCGVRLDYKVDTFMVIEDFVTVVLDALLNIQDLNLFVTATGIPTSVLSRPVEDKMDDIINTKESLILDNTKFLGDDRDYGILLGESNISDVIREQLHQAWDSGDDSASTEDMSTDIYNTAFVYITCVNVEGTIWESQQKQLLDSINETFDAEIRRMKELGIY